MSLQELQLQNEYLLNCPPPLPSVYLDSFKDARLKKDSDEAEKWFREATSQGQPLGINTQGYVAPFFEKAKVYGPPPQRTASPSDYKQHQYESDLNSLISKQFNRKSAFEEVVDILFSLSEKEQFLIDIGYILEFDHSDGAYDIYRKSSTGEKVRESKSMNEIFLKEISIKFKNLLLSKSTLKLKL